MLSYDLTNVLYLTQRVIGRDGFISVQEAKSKGSQPTWRRVWALLHPDQAGENLWPEYSSQSLDEARVTEVIDWAKTATFDGSVGYGRKVNAMASSGIVPANELAVAASLLRAFDRRLGSGTENVGKGQAVGTAAQPIASGYVGAVGDTLALTVTVVKSFRTQTKHGPAIVFKWRDSDGHAVTWFAYTAVPQDADKAGSTYRVQVKIDRHSAYQGVPETLVSRVTFLA